MAASQRRGARPSQVLPLPGPQPGARGPAGGRTRSVQPGSVPPGSGWAPPDPPPPPGRPPASGRRRRRVAAVVAVLAVVGTAAIVVGQRDAAPVQDRPLVTDVVTEDAVVAVLELYAAEVAMADAVAGPDPFALPGPVGRSLALAEAQEAAQSALTEIRDADVGPGTPALVYADHPDHDALLQVADRVLADTRALASLEGIHQTLLGGAPVTTPAQSAAALDAVLADPAADAGLRGWADALRQLVAGGGDPAVAAAARAEAAAAWRQSADRLGAAALADLTAFLNGIDPGVLAALDGHPVAGPALARLRRSDDASARLRRSGRRAHPHG